MHKLSAAFLAAVMMLSGAACGSEDQAAPGRSAPTAPTVPDGEAELGGIVEAAKAGLPDEVCESMGDVIGGMDPDSAEHVDQWNEDLAAHEAEIRSLVSPQAEDPLDRWLTTAKADMNARAAWYTSGGDASDRTYEIAFQNPRGLGADERAAARHDDAWVRLYFIQACFINSPEAPRWVREFSIDDWKWQPLTKGSAAPDEEFTDVSADLVNWSGDVLDTLASDGLAAIYDKYGAPECVAAVKDPLVAQSWNFQMFSITTNRDGEPFTIGVTVRPTNIQFSDTTQREDYDGSHGFLEAITVVDAESDRQLEDANCFAPIRAPFPRFG